MQGFAGQGRRQAEEAVAQPQNLRPKTRQRGEP
jgi:hypothetical protein